MSDYEAWLVVEEPIEAELLNMLDQYQQALEDDYHPPMALHWNDATLQLWVQDPEKLRVAFLQKQTLRAVTTAPEDVVRSFHHFDFTSVGTTFHIKCDLFERPNESPYSRRFLSLCPGLPDRPPETLPGVDSAFRETTLVVSDRPVKPNLWLEPQRLTLSDKQLIELFGTDGTGALPRLKRSFFLPPHRLGERPEALLATGELAPPISYFDPRLVEIRRDIFDLLGEFRLRQAAAAAALVRICDDPRVRDILMDGGSLQLAGEEGRSTSFNLNISIDAPPPAGYRSRMFLYPDQVEGPAWAQDFARSLRGDLFSLLPDGFNAVVAAKRHTSWEIAKPSRSITSGYADNGNWQVLNELRLTLRADPGSLLYELVLLPSSKRPGMDAPDHHMAELLFIQHAWRRPYVPVDPAGDEGAEHLWHSVFLDMLRTQLAGLTPAEWVDVWTQADAPSLEEAETTTTEPLNSGEEVTAFTLAEIPDSEYTNENVAILNYSGEPSADKVLRWRLLLPWRSIVNARTLILDHEKRSRLDSEFVLA